MKVEKLKFTIRNEFGRKKGINFVLVDFDFHSRISQIGWLKQQKCVAQRSGG
jgi:hypothetical protein